MFWFVFYKLSWEVFIVKCLFERKVLILLYFGEEFGIMRNLNFIFDFSFFFLFILFYVGCLGLKGDIRIREYEVIGV